MLEQSTRESQIGTRMEEGCLVLLYVYTYEIRPIQCHIRWPEKKTEL